MIQNPLQYRPGLALDSPVAVTMNAADWLTFMNWAAMDHVDTNGVDWLIFAVIAQQVREAVYTPASLKAAEAQIAEHRENMNPLNFLRNLSGNGPVTIEHLEDDGDA